MLLPVLGIFKRHFEGENVKSTRAGVPPTVPRSDGYKHSKKGFKEVYQLAKLFKDPRQAEMIRIIWTCTLNVSTYSEYKQRNIWDDCCFAMDVGHELIQMSTKDTTLLETKSSNGVMQNSFVPFFTSLASQHQAITDRDPTAFSSILAVLRLTTSTHSMSNIFRQDKITHVANILDGTFESKLYPFKPRRRFHIYQKFQQNADQFDEEDYQKFKHERDQLYQENIDLKENNVSHLSLERLSILIQVYTGTSFQVLQAGQTIV